MKPEEVDPPLTAEELETIEDMEKKDEEYFAKHGEHIICDIPLGAFEDEYDMSFYSTTVEEESERMKKEGII